MAPASVIGGVARGAAFAGCGRLACWAFLGDSGGAWLAHGRREGREMCNLSEWIVREAFLAYDRGDVTVMMDLVDPCLEWVRLDPGPADPRQQIRDGRGELEKALRE